MKDWKIQSKEAAKEGLCHTERECREMYADIPSFLKEQAISFLQNYLEPCLPEIRGTIAADPEHWNIPYHLWWGMDVRNALRKALFTEDILGIDNLDCIYKFLVEDAASR